MSRSDPPPESMPEPVPEMTPETSIKERVRLLEEFATATGFTAREWPVLSERVEDLNINAKRILVAIQQVDADQKAIVKLQTDLGKIRHRGKLVGLGIIMFLTLAVLGGLGYVHAVRQSTRDFQQVSRSVCVQRSTQATIIQKYLDSQVEQLKANKAISEAQKKVYLLQMEKLRTAFPNVNCSALVQN